MFLPICRQSRRHQLRSLSAGTRIFRTPVSTTVRGALQFVVSDDSELVLCVRELPAGEMSEEQVTDSLR